MPTPPEASVLLKALSVLEEVGAVDSEGDITPLGKQVVRMGCDVRVAKMLLWCKVYGCGELGLGIAGWLGVGKGIWASEDEGGGGKRKMWEEVCEGNDFLVFGKVWEGYKEAGAQAGSNKWKWCRENGIRGNVMSEISDIVGNLRGSLRGLTKGEGAGRNEGDVNVLGLCLAGGFGGNLLRREGKELRWKKELVAVGKESGMTGRWGRCDLLVFAEKFTTSKLWVSGIAEIGKLEACLGVRDVRFEFKDGVVVLGGHVRVEIGNARAMWLMREARKMTAKGMRKVWEGGIWEGFIGKGGEDVVVGMVREGVGRACSY